MLVTRAAGMAASVAVVSLVLAQSAAADVITPNTLTDEYNATAATCSLREAVQATNTDMPFSGCPTGNGADEIQLGDGTYQLSRADTGTGNDNGDLEVTSGDTLTISHAGSGRTAIDGGDFDRVLYNQGTLTISGLSVQNGSVSASIGGGIYNDGGSLTLTNALVTDNEIVGASGYGGGIFSQPGPLTLANVTVSGNRSPAGGLGGAGVYANSTGTFTNTTITANTSAGGTAAGLQMGVGTYNLKNTIIAGNTAPSDPDCNGAPGLGRVISSQGYNLIGNTAGCNFTLGRAIRSTCPRA